MGNIEPQLLARAHQQSRKDQTSYLTKIVVHPDVAEELVRQTALKLTEAIASPPDVSAQPCRFEGKLSGGSGQAAARQLSGIGSMGHRRSVLFHPSGERTQAAIAEASLTIYAQTGHSVPEEQLAVVARDILEKIPVPPVISHFTFAKNGE